MKLLVHDLLEDEFTKLNVDVTNTTVISARERTVHCLGCFGCWFRTPGKCVLKDSRPFFTYRGGKIHHMLRYKNRPKLKVYLYGAMTEFEKEIAYELVTMNGVNMGATSTKLTTACDLAQVVF